MIDKNFYLENLSAFDILIQDDREKAQEVIFRVFSILQRDKIWLRDVATEEEIFEEDAELLEEVEAELKELDQQYDFRFEEFYELVQQKLKKREENSSLHISDVDLDQPIDMEKDDEDFDLDDLDDEDEYFEDEENLDDFNSVSDEELDEIGDLILLSAKSRFNYEKLVYEFPVPEENFVDYEFLLPLIAGKAEEESDEVIAQKMQSSFLMSGFQIEVEHLLTLIQEKSKKLELEILAFQIAADSIQQGGTPTDVLNQINDFLKI